MKNTFEKLNLSGGSDGTPIQITGTAEGSSNIIHTAVNVAGQKDEVWVFANNVETGGNAIGLTIFVDTDSDATRLIVGVPFRQGLIYVIPGFVYANGKVIKAYASVANKINVHGWVNRITAI